MSTLRSLHICLLAAGILLLAPTMSFAAEEEKEPAKAAPKAQDGKPTRAELHARAGRAGIPTGIWLDVLRQQDVTEEQKKAITPIVRGYLESLEKWNLKQGPILKAASEQARTHRAETGEVPKALRDRISELRNSRPKPWVMQEKVWKRLTESQQQDFRFCLDEAKKHGFANPGGSSKGRVRSGAKSRPAPSKSTAKPDEAKARDSPQKPAAESSGSATKPTGNAPRKMPWSFID